MNRPLFAASLLLIAFTGTALATEQHGSDRATAQAAILPAIGPYSQPQPRFNNTNPLEFPRFIVQRGFSDAY